MDAHLHISHINQYLRLTQTGLFIQISTAVLFSNTFLFLERSTALYAAL